MAAGDSLMNARSKGRGKSGIKIKPSRVGSLHTALGVPQGQKIPASTISSRLKGASGNMREKLQFAQNAKKWG